ncbi:hypothetical protein PT974_05670 [Cladobotryum mycophilum]|uniref:Essential protein Yae1 N-terminal domain-containing protein n=1 Tax=Cladobotryum mycophilum TaxID=491253 RepID=A0ABR0SJR3_9HYPO
MSSDPLDDVFTLEDQFYTEGYNQGFKDGAQAGRIEGRSLGMEKGFEKFLESGRLAGRSLVWLNRLPQKNKTEAAEPDTLSTQNTDEAVQDFDDRVKRAQGKAKIVERIIN